MPNKYDISALSEHDRKILSKYTRFYSNFIESNTAQNEVLKEENFNGKTHKV